MDQKHRMSITTDPLTEYFKKTSSLISKIALFYDSILFTQKICMGCCRTHRVLFNNLDQKRTMSITTDPLTEYFKKPSSLISKIALFYDSILFTQKIWIGCSRTHRVLFNNIDQKHRMSITTDPLTEYFKKNFFAHIKNCVVLWFNFVYTKNMYGMLQNSSSSI